MEGKRNAYIILIGRYPFEGLGCGIILEWTLGKGV
jgi:hypothetical protein